MSREFETIDQSLMVEIIRRRQIPHQRPLSEPLPQFDILNCMTTFVSVVVAVAAAAAAAALN